MGRIIITENVSLDGVIQDPTGDEGFARGGWMGRVMDRQASAARFAEEAAEAEALLLGRRTYEIFAGLWPAREDPVARRLNEIPKYVVSSSLAEATWDRTTVLPGEAIGEVSELRRQIAGNLLVYGSGQLTRALLEHELVDELRLLVYPVLLGAGERLFGELGDRRPLALVESRAVDDLAFCVYRMATI